MTGSFCSLCDATARSGDSPCASFGASCKSGSADRSSIRPSSDSGCGTVAMSFQRCSKVSATAALTVSIVCFFHDETLPLASTGAGRSGGNGSGGDTANDNQIIDPAAAATLLDANTCIARIIGIVGTIHGDEMTILRATHQSALCYHDGLVLKVICSLNRGRNRPFTMRGKPSTIQLFRRHKPPIVL
jgi:hypothetical protein